MQSSNTSSAATSSPDATDTFSAAQLPIEQPVSDIDEAVRKLKQCSPSELQRVRRHHCRALKALNNGGYNALSEDTREHLLERLRTDLKALNQALDEVDTAANTTERSETAHELSSLFRIQDAISWPW